MARRGVSDQSEKRAILHHWAATVIQSRMREVLVRKRYVIAPQGSGLRVRWLTLLFVL